jgi:hypothetical protein
MLFGSFKGLSRAKRILEIAIKNKMNMSNFWLFTMRVTESLKELSGPMKIKEFPSHLIILLFPVV